MKKDIVIPIVNVKRPTARGALRKFFLIDKLNSKVGYALLFVILALVAVGMADSGPKFGFIVLGIMIGVPVIYGIVAHPRFGIVVFMIMSYLLMWILRMGVNVPLGTAMDGMEALFILSIFINQKKKKDWSFVKGPISFWILIWLCYIMIEVVNPDAASQMAWLYTVRSVAIIMLMYFIFMYYVDTKKYIRLLFKVWIALAFFGALYAFKQEHFGFFGFETNYLNSDPNITNLLFIAGVWRKFSIFSDPVAFAYNMITASLLCLGLMTGPISKSKKIILSCLIFFFLYAMLSSGTRGAYALIPTSMLMYSVLKYNKKLIMAMAVMAVGFVGLIFMPTSNPTLYRFQTAFKPSDDASFNVRAINQKKIQPFVQSHPLGGGLGSTGVWGAKFAPNSYLAHFPPDSGYVRVAVECGWLGLLIFCILMFTILKTGIEHYYKIRDPELKSYCLACVLIVFALNIGNYPQEALVQFPSTTLFYLVVALIMVTMRLDKQQNEIADGPAQ